MLSRNAGIIALVDSNDNNLCQYSSFNYEIKEYEATESLEFFEFVQNAFALLRKDSIGSKG